MGDKNPLLERRGSIGYAFCQEDNCNEEYDRNESISKSNESIQMISPHLSPVAEGTREAGSEASSNP